MAEREGLAEWLKFDDWQEWTFTITNFGKYFTRAPPRTGIWINLCVIVNKFVHPLYSRSGKFICFGGSHAPYFRALRGTRPVSKGTGLHQSDQIQIIGIIQ